MRLISSTGKQKPLCRNVPCFSAMVHSDRWITVAYYRDAFFFICLIRLRFLWPSSVLSQGHPGGGYWFTRLKINSNISSGNNQVFLILSSFLLSFPHGIHGLKDAIDGRYLFESCIFFQIIGTHEPLHWVKYSRWNSFRSFSLNSPADYLTLRFHFVAVSWENLASSVRMTTSPLHLFARCNEFGPTMVTQSVNSTREQSRWK